MILIIMDIDLMPKDYLYIFSIINLLLPTITNNIRIAIIISTIIILRTMFIFPNIVVRL